MTIQDAPDDSERTADTTRWAPESAEAAEQFHPDIAEAVPTQAPVLITEQEVLFGTAATLPPQPAKRTRWFTAALHRVAVAAVPQPHHAPRHYPRRSLGYFETSLISREGHRL